MTVTIIRVAASPADGAATDGRRRRLGENGTEANASTDPAAAAGGGSASDGVEIEYQIISDRDISSALTADSFAGSFAVSLNAAGLGANSSIPTIRWRSNPIHPWGPTPGGGERPFPQSPWP